MKDYFLRSDGSRLFLDAAAPTSPSPKTRDSGSVKYAGGNPWATIGWWSVTLE
jgi:hypothetical protein